MHQLQHRSVGLRRAQRPDREAGIMHPVVDCSQPGDSFGVKRAGLDAR